MKLFYIKVRYGVKRSDCEGNSICAPDC